MTSLLYLSDKRTLFVGHLARTVSQASTASALFLSVDKELDLVDHLNNRAYRSKSFLIPAGVNATIDTHDSIVVLIFLDALGVDLATLVSKMKEPIVIDANTTIYSGINRESNVIKRAHFLLENQPSAKDAFDQLEEWIGEPAPNTNIPSDDRVTKAVALIKDSYSQNLSVEDIAKQLGLSVPRMSQLFKQITGVPIRRFRLWHRIFVTALKVSKGLSLTEAAISSGFSDYSQFSRTFKEIGGVSPSDILSLKSHTLIRVLNSLDDTCQTSHSGSAKSGSGVQRASIPGCSMFDER